MIAYIGLGSNLAQPLTQLQSAIRHISSESGLQLIKTSSFYQSKALTLGDAPAQNDYINAVVMLETAFSAELLLQVLHKIEAVQGRERLSKWAARTLDLDILLYGDEIINTETLTIPHAQMQYRNFVIHPLYEIAGDIELPALGCLSALVKKMPYNDLIKLSSY